MTVREALIGLIGAHLGFALATSIATRDWSWLLLALGGAAVGGGLGVRARLKAGR